MMQHHVGEVYAKFDIGVRKGDHDEGERREKAHFGHCILHVGGIERVEQNGFVNISVGLEGDNDIVPLMLDIYREAGPGRLPFGHSNHCPAFLMDKDKDEFAAHKKEEIRVGICVIVEHRGKILVGYPSFRITCESNYNSSSMSLITSHPFSLRGARDT